MAFLKYIGWTIIVSGIVFLLLLVWFFVLGFGPEQYYSPDPYCDTEMAKDFSLEKFAGIKPGMDSTAVLKILGRPLCIQHDTFCGHFQRIRFEYTTDGKLLKTFGEGDQAWFNAVVSFDTTGKVTDAGGDWIYD